MNCRNVEIRHKTLHIKIQESQARNRQCSKISQLCLGDGQIGSWFFSVHPTLALIPTSVEIRSVLVLHGTVFTAYEARDFGEVTA